jgi:hypothetical protein
MVSMRRQRCCAVSESCLHSAHCTACASHPSTIACRPVCIPGSYQSSPTQGPAALGVHPAGYATAACWQRMRSTEARLLQLGRIWALECFCVFPTTQQHASASRGTPRFLPIAVDAAVVCILQDMHLQWCMLEPTQQWCASCRTCICSGPSWHQCSRGVRPAGHASAVAHVAPMQQWCPSCRTCLCSNTSTAPRLVCHSWAALRPPWRQPLTYWRCGGMSV